MATNAPVVQATVVQAQPVGQPVQVQAGAQPAMMQPQMYGQNVPPGAPPGGQWVQDQYIGIITILLALLVCICIFCCPLDQRTVYLAPDGRKFKKSGAIAEACDCSPD